MLPGDLFEKERLCVQELIVAGAGHRPHKLGGYSRDVQDKLRRFLVLSLRKLGPNRVLSGMALGFDQALAHAALDLNVPFDAIVPFVGQEQRWPFAAQLDYRHLLKRASAIVIVSDGGFAPDKMQIRNEYMVDHSNLLLSLWNGSSGGTQNCVKYAEKKSHEILHLWRDWLNTTAGEELRWH